jgi:hypothetical protein
MHRGISAPRCRFDLKPSAIDAGQAPASGVVPDARLLRQLGALRAQLHTLESYVLSKVTGRPPRAPKPASCRPAGPPKSSPRAPEAAPRRPARYVLTKSVSSPVPSFSLGRSGNHVPSRSSPPGQTPGARREQSGLACHSRPMGRAPGKRGRTVSAATVPVSMPPTAFGRWARQLPIRVGCIDVSLVVKRLLGPGGSHVRKIAAEHGAKLRVRGVGSGHREGRNREEAPVPLHMCVSAPTEPALKAAVADAQQLIARATGNQDSSKGSRPPVLRIALANEGKLSDAISYSVSGWARENGIAAVLVSEGALPGRSIATENGYSWAVPLKQNKGGAGFLLRDETGPTGGKVKIQQCPERRWSLAIWRTPGGTGLISAYINPVDVRNDDILTSFLLRLGSLAEGFPRCIIGGDFNSPSGTPHRGVLNRWIEETPAARRTLRLRNTGDQILI